MAHDWFSIVKDSYFIMLYFLIFSAMHASLEKKINYFKVRNSILKKKKNNNKLQENCHGMDKSLDSQV